MLKEARLAATVNLHIYSDFLLFLSIHTICAFYDNFSNSFLYLNLIYNIFFRWVSFKMIGNYGQMTNSKPSGRLI